ncbi:MAG: hypothetical protein ABW252_16750 [Polyangiales bacterium]
MRPDFALVLSLLAGVVSGAVVGATPMPARASVVEAMDLEALVREADEVVVARVLKQESHYDAQQHIVTDYLMQVERVEKGSQQPGAAVTVRKLGGVVGERGMRISGEPSFEVGETVVLFGQRGGRTYLRPVGMAQGALRVFEQDGVQWARTATGGLSLRGAQAKSLASQGPRRLDDLLGEVRALVEAQR